MSFFTSIGEILNAATWFQLIKWPFWVLVIILAACGIHTAHHGKGNLMSQGFRGALKLALVYMLVVAGYIWVPKFMVKLPLLPFFSASEEAISLMNPLSLLEKWNTDMPRTLVQLYFLLFFINAASVFEYSTPNFIGWFFFQSLFTLAGIGIYALIAAGITTFWPFAPDILHKLLAIVLTLIFAIVIFFKIYFALIVPGDNHKFQRFYQFLTQQKFGSLFSVTALSFVFVLVYLFAASLFGQAVVKFGSFNSIAFLITSVMCTLTLFVFSRYYCPK